MVTTNDTLMWKAAGVIARKQNHLSLYSVYNENGDLVTMATTKNDKCEFGHIVFCVRMYVHVYVFSKKSKLYAGNC